MPSLQQLDYLVSPDPIPADQFPGVPFDQLLSWQERTTHCLQSICMKQALYLSLVNHTKVPAREAISSALATFTMEDRANITEERINAFLTTQFATHNVDLAPNGRFLSSEDFLTAFGFKQAFESSIVAHLQRFCHTLSAGKELGATPDLCVAREALPVLSELAREMVLWEAQT